MISDWVFVYGLHDQFGRVAASYSYDIPNPDDVVPSNTFYFDAYELGATVEGRDGTVHRLTLGEISNAHGSYGAVKLL